MLKPSFALSLALAFSFALSIAGHAQSIDDEEDDGSAIVESDDPVSKDEPFTKESPSHSVTGDYSPIAPEVEKESSASGEKIFDWDKYKGAKEVPHPFAGKGLTRITKDREYIYKVDESKQNRAASFRVGIFNPSNLSNPEAEAGSRGSTFDDNYDQTSNPALMFDYEWQLLNLPIGKIGIRAGTGAYIAQGNGHFVSGPNQDLTPEEIFTFWAMPNALGAVYRMQLWDRQLLIPYAEGGGIAFAFGEFRDDDQPPKWGGALAAYYAVGGALNLTYFDAASRIALDREYGINRVYLTMEYRGILAVTTKYDFSSDLINGGLLMEF